MRRAKLVELGADRSRREQSGRAISWSSRAAISSRRRSIDASASGGVERSICRRASARKATTSADSKWGAGLAPSCSTRSASSPIRRSIRSSGAVRKAAEARRLRTSSVCRLMRSNVSGLIAVAARLSILPPMARISRSSPAATACGSCVFSAARNSAAIASSGIEQRFAAAVLTRHLDALHEVAGSRPRARPSHCAAQGRRGSCSSPRSRPAWRQDRWPSRAARFARAGGRRA